jgi:hypothetical protein
MTMKSLKFLNFNNDYPDFLQWLDAQHPGLEKKFYEEQMHLPHVSLFAVEDRYFTNLRKLGREVWNIHDC